MIISASSTSAANFLVFATTFIDTSFILSTYYRWQEYLAHKWVPINSQFHDRYKLTTYDLQARYLYRIPSFQLPTSRYLPCAFYRFFSCSYDLSSVIYQILNFYISKQITQLIMVSILICILNRSTRIAEMRCGPPTMCPFQFAHQSLLGWLAQSWEEL